jgi:hypothetical protein
MSDIVEFTLELKRRKGDNRIILPLNVVKALMRNPNPEIAKQELWNYFEPVLETDIYTHDKLWIKKLIDWQPPGGLALSAIAEWFPLIGNFKEIDDSKDCDFVITKFQAGLLSDRLQNDKFIPFPEVPGQPPPEISVTFIEFVMYFNGVCGFHFGKEEPEPKKIEKKDKEEK